MAHKSIHRLVFRGHACWHNTPGHLHEGIDLLVGEGVSEEAILQGGFVTPSCGLASLSPGLVDQILDLTVAVSREMRARYVDEEEIEEEEGDGE